MNESGATFVVTPDDYGIRPGGGPDACTYCKSKVGELHGPECILVHRAVVYEVRSEEFGVVAQYSTSEPADWDEDMMRFARNEGTWCKGNIIDHAGLRVLNDKAWAAITKDDDCLCMALELEPGQIGEEVFRAGE